MLNENAEKNVVIRSNNNVPFTFEKGIMQAVDGKDSYDFSTTISNTYSEELPYYITQNNFCSSCGTKLENGSKFCPVCGDTVIGD